MRDFNASGFMTGVGMMVHNQITVYGPGRFTVRNVNTQSDRTLMQIGLAVRVAGREADHGGGRDTPEDNNSDVGHTLVTDMLEHGINIHTVFKNGLVGHAAEAVHTA